MNDSVRVGTEVGASLSNESVPTPTPTTGPTIESAGYLLKAARERLGLDIAALAAAMKVPVRKLEALEDNRWSELTDTTFARALASSVARHLKMDPSLVLQGLPSGKPLPLTVAGGMDHSAAIPAGGRSAFPAKSVMVSVVLLLLAALVVYLSPQFLPKISDAVGQWSAPVAEVKPFSSAGSDSSVPMATGATVSVSSPPETLTRDMATGATDVPSPVLPSAAAGSAESAQPSASPDPAAQSAAAVSPAPVKITASPGAPALQIKVNRASWVEVKDVSGLLRIQRILKAEESVEFSGETPYTVVLGNASGAQVTVWGKGLDLGAVTKNNIARFDVK
jgi:cytoskeleton protein RodZ